ncbi:hypothetical protein [Desulfoluna spongiiphila]|uniref:Uncharacterized protein n=1 Tax=Desulfoluna spongiiphila TaxID=419481 RepID=A0A1G5E1A0_9BACT|nr:hypothetical protein [Desulfoluna spongiiphila]SCY20774.1 hypothetical protein SAMN05216233_105115 [Desulfoluna spongiiphila]
MAMDLQESLYAEHLEESSMLYEQWHGLVSRQWGAWRRIIDFERRLEAHLDALVIGGDQALELCREKARQGDSGELYAAARVLLRHGLHGDVCHLVDGVDSSDSFRIQALSDALCVDLEAKDEEECFQLLLKNGPVDASRARVASRLAGYRRCGGWADELFRLLGSRSLDADSEASVLNALVPLKSSRHLLNTDWYGQSGEGLCRTSAVLIRARAGQAIDDEVLLQVPVCCGLCGDKQAFGLLRTMPVNDDVLFAMGLLGDVEAVPFLIRALDYGEQAEAAALSLYVMTGAPLYETVFIPEAVDEDLLFDAEKEKLARGESLWPPGKEPGETVTRLAREGGRWSSWWQDHADRFDSARRYRNGRLCTPNCLIENLGSESVPATVREAAYDELAIRYNVDFSFDRRMPVEKQVERIKKYEVWDESASGQFEPGAWYFGGHVMESCNA